MRSGSHPALRIRTRTNASTPDGGSSRSEDASPSSDAPSHDAAAAPAGGTLIDGTYVLVSALQHDPTGDPDGVIIGSYGKLTVAFSGVVAETIRTSPVLTRRWSDTFSATGTDLTLTATCAFPAAPKTIEFTATSTTLTTFESAVTGGGKTVVIELAYQKL